MAPGIEPENLIRSILIRYPPGPFLLKLSNKVTGVTEQNAVKNKVVYHYILYYVLLCHACNVIAMFLSAFDRNYQQNKINKLTPTLILRSSWLRLISFYNAVYGFISSAFPLDICNKLTHI